MRELGYGAWCVLVVTCALLFVAWRDLSEASQPESSVRLGVVTGGVAWLALNAPIAVEWLVKRWLVRRARRRRLPRCTVRRWS